MSDKYTILEEEHCVDDLPVRDNPAEKARIRAAAEMYNGTYNTYDGPYEDDSPKESKSKSGNGKVCTKAEKQLTILLVLCIIIIIVMSALLVLLRLEMDDMEDCEVASGSVLAQMDLSINPCDDFYEYACSRGLRDPSEIPPDKGKWGIFSKLEKRNQAIIKRILDFANGTYQGVNSTAVTKAKTYYDTCMNATLREIISTESVLEVLSEVGSWPLTDSAWKEDSWKLEDSMAAAHSYALNPLFNVYVSADDKDSNKQIICFDQAGTTFSDYTQYSGNDSEKYHAAFVKYFTSVTTLLGVEETKAKTAAEDVWQFEKSISDIQTRPENRTDPWSMYHMMTLEKLSETFAGWMDLSLFMENLFKEKIPVTERILVYAPEFLEKLSDLVKNADKQLLSTYISWHMLSSLVPYLPLSFRLAQLDLGHALFGVEASPALWEECVSRTSDTMGFAVGGLFVEESFDEDSKKNVEKILDNIRDAFVEALPSIKWMDVNTRELALDKAKAIIEKIGYPDFIRNSSSLDAYYAKLEVKNTNEMDNSLLAKQFFVRRNLEKRKNATDRTEWAMFPQTVNAYYSPSLNEIVFPAGILQKPFYDISYPQALVYGAIGMVIGHELTHGFDNMGRQYDKFGNLHNWWTNSSAVNFEQRTQCLVEQYSQFDVFTQKLNGLTTLGENIADNGGIKSAYNAYKNWQHDSGISDIKLPGLNMTSDQLFFLSFSQVWCAYYTPEYAVQSLTVDSHSYAKYRVIGVLQNNEEFAKAFKCPAGSPMNPDKKCSVW